MKNTIQFDTNYPKLCNQSKAQLVHIHALYFEDFLKRKDLIDYDTKRYDGSHYEYNKTLSYLLLFFVGDKGIMFSSLRKMNSENADKYLNKIGKWFYIDIQNEYK